MIQFRKFQSKVKKIFQELILIIENINAKEIMNPNALKWLIYRNSLYFRPIRFVPMFRTHKTNLFSVLAFLSCR